MDGERIESFYLLVGGDGFLREQALARIKTSLFGARTPGFDYAVFYGSQATAREIIESVRTFPFISRRRLVVLREADQLALAEKKTLIRYCLNPSSSSCLVIETEEAGPRGVYRAALSGRGKTVLCQPPAGRELGRWIESQVKQAGKRIAPDAVELLQESSGRELSAIAAEVEKLTLYVGKREVIERRDVEALVGRSAENSVFDFLRAVERKNPLSALAVLQDLFTEGKETGEIIGVIGWQIRRIKKVKERLRRGAARQEIARELNIRNRYVLSRLLREAESSEFAAVEDKLNDLLKTDVALKTGRLKPRTGLELLTIKLCRG